MCYLHICVYPHVRVPSCVYSSVHLDDKIEEIAGTILSRSLRAFCLTADEAAKSSIRVTWGLTKRSGCSVKFECATWRKKSHRRSNPSNLPRIGINRATATRCTTPRYLPRSAKVPKSLFRPDWSIVRSATLLFSTLFGGVVSFCGRSSIRSAIRPTEIFPPYDSASSSSELRPRCRPWLSLR